VEPAVRVEFAKHGGDGVFVAGLALHDGIDVADDLGILDAVRIGVGLSNLR